MSSKKSKNKSKNNKDSISEKNSLFRFMGAESTQKKRQTNENSTLKNYFGDKLKEKKQAINEQNPTISPEKSQVTVQGQIENIKQEVTQLFSKQEEKKSSITKKKGLSTSVIVSKKILQKSDLDFYKKRTELFGEQAFPIQLNEEEKKGNVKSVYVEYLVKNDQICTDMKEGILLTVEYSGKHNKAYAKFYDLTDHTIKFWLDTTNHRPYAIHRASKEEIESIAELTEFQGYDGVDSVQLEDLLFDRKIVATKIYGKTPSDIGKKGETGDEDDTSSLRSNSIYNILARNGYDGAWEANIRYHHNFIYDRELIPGLIYQIKNGSISPIHLDVTSDIEKRLLELFAEESKTFQEMAQRYMKVFSYPIPEVRRVAFDIEVEVPKSGNLPDSKLAHQRIISISFSGSDGFNQVYVLWRDEVPIGVKNESFPENAEILFFSDEKDLVTETFRILWEYPLIISFNGDNFDLNYLFHRAKTLNVPNELNPIEIKHQGGQTMVKTNAYLKHGIHVDLYQIFANRSLKGYAFGDIYEHNSLDEISLAFIGSEKIKRDTGQKFTPKDIATLDLFKLAYYNMIDSVLTLELTSFGNNTIWNLLVYLMRITKLPLQDLFRHQISFWIRNILYYEHRIRGYLIPRQSELAELKPGMGEDFEGGRVLNPVPGIHFNVSVMDFSSLYPTIIKSRNLSYETVKCPHIKCQSELLPDVPYHVCKERLGIFALVVGFFRDIRVKWFKPRSSDKTVPTAEREFAKILQSALKVFINGAYGVFGSPNFPLRCNPVAESTTAIGRYAIQETARKAEEIGIRVLYGDTDSVFLDAPTKAQIEEMAQWSKRKLDLDLEEEKVYQFLALSQRKKNYVGVYKGGQIVDVKGMSAKKSNTPLFIFKAFEEISEILKKITTQQEFETEKKNILKIIRSYAKRIGQPEDKEGFPIEDYAISTKLTKSISSYTKTKPQHVKAAEMEERASGIRLESGDYITYVKTRDSSRVKPISITEIQDIDTKKYHENLQNVLEQLLDALNISWEEVKGMKKLDAFGI